MTWTQQLTQDFADRFPTMCHHTVGQDFPDATIVAWNEQLAHELGIKEYSVGDFVGREGVALGYSGHQFGTFNPVMGDGRAMLLGELNGKDIHLKGSGRTPYSKPGADGKLPMGAALREFVVSEFLHTMEVPTSRTLAVIKTGERLTAPRGKAGLPYPPGAITVRVATHHIRIGTIQHAAMQDADLVKDLVEYTLERNQDSASLFEQVVEKQAKLIAKFMRLGFVHGVLNTDNVQLAGEAIDFGPCAFLDSYEPHAWFSSIDTHGRYAFDQQAQITQWNLARLAEALVPMWGDDAEAGVEYLTKQLQRFPELYNIAYDAEMTEALGPNWQDKLHTCEDYRKDYPTVLGHVVPRNHALQNALNDAEAGDMTAFHAIVEDLRDPFHGTKKSGITLAGNTGFTSYCGT